MKDFVNCNAKQDAELLHKAMKGIGKLDALKVINIKIQHKPKKQTLFKAFYSTVRVNILVCGPKGN